MSAEFVPRNLNDQPSEIVIIRRRSSALSDGEGHGGIWKIAYADFMTALMAFFLVMWLLNATGDKTISAVASYFNPVKLTDRQIKKKGPYDMDGGAPGQTSEPVAPQGQSRKSQDDLVAATGSRPTHTEDALFADPYGALEKLAAKGRAYTEPDKRAEGTAGDAFRDPFDPDFRSLVTRAYDANWSPAATQGIELVAASSPRHRADEATAALDESAHVRTGGTAGPTAQRGAQDFAEEIRAALRDAAPGRIPNVEVTSLSDGILISLTDEFDFGMFAIASAEPRPEMVLIMERLAEVLKDHDGPIVVRGHTDGRPFRTPTYDNWRLSSARAHMAYFMLVRGGVDEERFERIEGHADRSLKVVGDPEAAQNRRIEIFLRKVQAS